MNDAHIHIAINHFPLIVPIIGVVLLLAAYGLKSEVLKRTSLLLFVFGGLAAYPAYESGEKAEEIVEEIRGVDHDYIHEHEEIAETFSLLSYILAAVAFLSFLASWRKFPFASILSVGTLLFSVIVIYYGVLTGTSGGEIRHTEIRQDGIQVLYKE